MGMNMKIVPNYQRQEEQSDKNESVFINKLIFELDKFVQGNRYGKFLVL